ncbi:hypothetical protein [Rubrobacter calidifluminis]|uniref:hypothetical protein n=1 Tax=Rubrobacter calidifluminis TaxID=1392640 RepID=UPI00235FEB49|nr:hypothetical protein [Rubrobacter calidifluminis]
MSEERDRQKSFLSRIFSTGEEEETMVFSTEDFEFEEVDEPEEAPPRSSFTVERAAEIIKSLPDDVPRESAVRIVRQTLAAAGIDIEELARSADRRESKLNSRIDLSQRRSEELKRRTREVISSLEEEIRKAREARDFGVSEEEKKISQAREGLADVALVREFFELSRTEEVPDEEPSGPGSWDQDETQIIDRENLRGGRGEGASGEGEGGR